MVQQPKNYEWVNPKPLLLNKKVNNAATAVFSKRTTIAQYYYKVTSINNDIMIHLLHQEELIRTAGSSYGICSYQLSGIRVTAVTAWVRCILNNYISRLGKRRL